MAKTNVQKLTSAVLQLNQNPDDAAAAKQVQELAAIVGPEWAKATKPEALSAGRVAFTTGWIIQAGVDPVSAASNGEAAASALSALTATIDGIPPTWVEIWLSDGPLPSLEEIGDAIAGLAKKGVDAVTPGMGILPWAIGGAAVLWFLSRRKGR